MKILLTNDDGITSEGLRLLGIELQKYHDVYIVAPDTERSAVSQSITLRKTLDLKKVHLEGIKNDVYTLTGTPADCVRIGLKFLYPDVDVVFSGINRGYNTGLDVKYSGTIGAASEATVYGKPGVALSTEFIDGSSDFEIASKFAPIIFNKYQDLIMKEPLVLSINVPKLDETAIKGLVVCKLGGLVDDNYNIKKHSDKHWEITSDGRAHKGTLQDTDQYYLQNGYITITPIKYSYGNSDLIQQFQKVK